MERTLSETISKYICSTDYDALPAEVRDKTVLCICDYLGCIYASTTLELHKILLELAKEDFPRGTSQIVGSEIKVDPVMAAFVNGVTASLIVLDDMFKAGIYHPAVITVTSALAIAGKKKVTGKEFITAIVLGYEISNRLSEACNPSHYKYWHTSGTVGCFGAAVTAAKLLNCTEEETVWAIGNAGTQAAGSQECNGNAAQNLHLGLASRSGVLAALMAKKGIDGPKHILEGPAGFFAAMTEFDGDLKSIFADLGTRYTIMENTFKYYPTCGHTFASIDGGLLVMKNNNLSYEDIIQIDVGTYQTALTNSGNPDPQNIQEAQFSIPYCVSSAIVKGEFTINEFNTWPPSDEIKNMIKKVRTYHDEESETMFPKARGAKVTVHTKNGSFTEFRKFRKGDPEWSLTKEEVVGKFRALAGYSKTPGEISKIEEMLEMFPELQDVTDIII